MYVPVHADILETCAATTDLAESEDIQSAHLVEALQDRPKLMMGN